MPEGAVVRRLIDNAARKRLAFDERHRVWWRDHGAFRTDPPRSETGWL